MSFNEIVKTLDLEEWLVWNTITKLTVLIVILL
jgi:hypothetical protein